MHKRKRKSILCVCILGLLCILGTLWQSTAVKTDSRNYLAVGSYADLHSYQAHYVLQGFGETAIVFVEGSGTPCAYTDFYALQTKLSESYTTLSFDRAGGGWSSSTAEKREIDQLTDELSLVLAQTVGEKPIILVCHSLGALEAIHYAQRFPERVKGIVFLDAGTPAFYQKDSELLAKFLNVVNAVLRTLGMTRLLERFGCFLPIYGENARDAVLPESERLLDRAMYCRYAGNPAVLAYIDCMNENADVVQAGERLGRLPILVLSSDAGQSWGTVQKELAAWSENSTQITLKNSHHYLHHTNQKEVIAYITQWLTEVLT